MPAIQASIPVSRPKSIAVRGPRGERAKPQNVIADVRSHIAFWDQTNPAKFPPYEFNEYPKMMLDPNGIPYADEASGEAIVVYDEDEEREFAAEHPVMIVVNNTRLNREEREELELLRASKPGSHQSSEAEGEGLAGPSNKLAAAMTGKQAKSGGQKLKDRGGAPLPKPLKA